MRYVLSVTKIRQVKIDTMQLVNSIDIGINSSSLEASSWFTVLP